MATSDSSATAAQRSGAAAGRPRTYRRAPDEKRDRIAEAAAELFAERGFGGVTTAEIAAAAGVSEGILFHHFGSKRELLGRVAADYGRGLARAMFGEWPGEDEVSPETAIRRAFDYVGEHRSLHRLLMVRDHEQGEPVHSKTREEIVGALEAVCRVGVERGRLRPMNARIVAELSYALVEGALDACFVYGGGARRKEYLREAVRCVAGAIAPIAEDRPGRTPGSETARRSQA